MARFSTGDILFNRYRIERLVGQGAFAEVYLATHLDLHAPRALKVLLRARGLSEARFQDMIARFRLEAQLGGQFAQEPHIVQVYDFEKDEARDLWVLVTEYLAGGSLAARIRRAGEAGQQGLPVAFVVRTAYHAALGLAALHRAGLVHRDIKPSNILYDEAGRAKIADLGLAQTRHGLSQRTELGSLARRHPGTPEYMSPEQETTVGYLRPASDIYSLGVTLFEALTLRNYKHLRPGTRVSQFRSDVPGWLDDLLVRMLAKAPEERPWDGGQFVALLQPHVSRPARFARTMGMLTKAPDGRPEDGGQFVAPRQPHVLRPARFTRTMGILAIIFFVVLFGGLLFVRHSAPPTATISPEMNASSSQLTQFATSPPTWAPTVVLSATVSPAFQQVGVTQQLPTATLWPTLTSTSRPEQMVNSIDGAILRYIPAGHFTLGLTWEQVEQLLPYCEDSSGCRDLLYASSPARQAWVDAFWIYQTEVSNEMYRQCVEDGACSPPRRSSSETRSDYYQNPMYAHFPVTAVSWYQARAYCQWAGGRLPTNAEWEYAARGDDGRLFPWGNALPTADRANVDNLYGDTVPVDEFAQYASPFGVLNMTGNVWEWVEDWWSASYYRENQDWENPKGPAQGDLIHGRPVRAGRGGSYWIRSVLGSVAVWDWDHPDAAGWGDGFRCVIPIGRN